MTVAVLGSYRLDEINLGAAELAGLVPPILSSLDLALMGSFGLGALQADIAAELNGALSTQQTLSVQVSNPVQALKDSLEAAVRIQASIGATLALGLPVVSAEISAEVTASAALAGALGAKLGGIQAVIDGALAAKFPLLDFLRDLLANLNAGPVVLLSFGTPTADTLQQVGFQIDSLFSGGVEGIVPTDPVFGLVLLTRQPSVWLAMQAILKAS